MAGGNQSLARADRFRGDIQGMRAIAVGAVVLYHAGVPFLGGGYVGVDVFFVISGFLITTHLLQGLARDGHVRFASFYAKRARRILPASFLVLVLTVIAALLWVPPLLMREVWRGAVATALYVPNVLFAVEGTNYLAEETPSLFQHYWSLGIEEQFYLVWPVLLAIVWRWAKLRRALLAILIIVVVVSFAAGVVLTSWRQPWAFFLLPTRAWELAIGGVVALVLLRRPTALPPMAAPIAGWVGLAAVITPIFFFSADTPFPGYWAAVPVLGTALVILGGATPSRFGPTRLLSVRGMLLIGAISYSLYLVHWPALLIPQMAVGYAHPLPLWAKLLIAALCVPVAWVLYRFVENPARTFSWFARARPRRSLIAAAAGSAACLAVATVAFAYSNAQPLYSTKAAEAVPPSADPVMTPFVPSNLTPSLREVADDKPVTYVDGCHLSFEATSLEPCLYGQGNGPRIVLFGDSHAAQWFPALRAIADKHGLSIENRTKSSCGTVNMTLYRAGVEYRECAIWRADVIEQINEDPPELVIVSNSGGETSVDDAEAWGRALAETLSAIDAPTALIADTPWYPATPAICLSAHLTDALQCATPRDLATASHVRMAEEHATQAERVPYLDLNDYLCTATECAPIVGDVLAYRDAHHLTATFSASLHNALWAALVDRIPELMREP